MSSLFQMVGQEGKDRFDAFVEAAKGHPCQSFAWAEMNLLRGWQPVRAVLEHRGSIVATIAALRKPMGRWCLLDVVWGPVADWSDSGTARHVLRALKRFARQQRALYLRVNPEAQENEGLKRALIEEGFRPAVSEWRYQCTTVVSLTQPLESIQAHMEKRMREAIRRAERLGVEVSTAQDDRDIEAFLEMYLDTGRRKGLAFASPRYVRSLCGNNQLTRLFLAYLDGRLAAGKADYTFGRRLVGAFAASAHPCPPGAGVYLEWYTMCWGKEHGFVEYDLAGIPRSAQPGDDQWGVYLFKRGFGGRRVDLVGEYERCAIPALTGVCGRLLQARSTRKRRRSRSEDA